MADHSFKNMVLIEREYIMINTTTPFSIFQRHWKYPLNPPGEDVLPLFPPGKLIDAKLLSQIYQVDKCYIEKKDQEAWQNYVAEIRKTINPAETKVALARVEDLVVHMLDAGKNSSFDEAKMKGFNNVAENVVGIVKQSTDAVKFIKTLIEHSSYTYYHSAGVGILAPAIAMELGETDPNTLQEYSLGGLMHDVGKLDIDDAIINKPDALNDEEWKLLKAHPLNGVKKVKDLPQITKRILNMIEFHHEKIGGNGYPHGLKKDAIPVEARVVAVADIFNALTTTRSYRHKRTAFEALMLIRHEMINDIWPPALDALVKILAKDVMPVKKK